MDSLTFLTVNLSPLGIPVDLADLVDDLQCLPTPPLSPPDSEASVASPSSGMSPHSQPCSNGSNMNTNNPALHETQLNSLPLGTTTTGGRNCIPHAASTFPLVVPQSQTMPTCKQVSARTIAPANNRVQQDVSQLPWKSDLQQNVIGKVFRMGSLCTVSFF